MNIILILTIVAILMIIAWAIRGERIETKEDQPAKDQPIIERENKDEPERIFRRRASDREIEKEYPTEESSYAPIDESVYDRRNTDGQIELPFSANEIISDGSRFKLYKRALLNSEIYAKRGDFETAISLYKGVKDRILDSDIRNKIESNINYLNNFRQQREKDLRKKIESTYPNQLQQQVQQLQQQQQEIRLKIEGVEGGLPQTINIALPEKNIIDTDEIVGKISDRINNDLSNMPEFSNLKDEFNSLKDLIGELAEERAKTSDELNKLKEKQEDDLSQDNNREMLNDIKEQIDNLSDIKRAMDELHEKMKDVKVPGIPESERPPTIIQARYDSPIPIHFDPQPVIDLLDKIDQRRKGEKTEDKTEEKKEEKIEDNKSLDNTSANEDLFNKTDQPEDKIEDSKLLDNAPANEDLFNKTDQSENKTEQKPEETAKSEKETERFYDGEEDPNEFDLLSDMGKIKDESTITDDEIFEKILRDANREKNTKDFEIVGETPSNEPEFSSAGMTSDSKFKSDQDFYKKFINTDRVKKKELPILRVSYDFKKLPDEFSLSREKNILEYAFYKYKPMLQRADEFMKNKHIKDAINYYKVVLDQNIPIEFKAMLRRNIKDLSEYLEKYFASE